jgi:phage terminase large subunit-like protein
MNKRKLMLSLSSSTTDLTGLVLIFPPQEGLSEFAFISEGWIPEDNMKERVKRDGVAYDRWVNKGYMHATAGNVVDYEFVEARILQISKQYKLVKLGTDSWNSRMLTQRLMNEGIEVIEIAQSMSGLSSAMKETERWMKLSVFFCGRDWNTKIPP